MKNVAAILTLAVTLAACGGGSGGSSASAAPNAPVAAKPVQMSGGSYKTYSVTTFGDSIMWGIVRPGNSNANAYTSQYAPQQYLVPSLQSIFPAPTVIQLDKEAVPGTTLHQLLTGTDGTHGVFTQTLSTNTTQVLIEEFGVNDAWHMVYDSANYNLNQFAYDLSVYIETARSYGKIVVLEEPNPICSDAATSAQLDNIVAIIDQASVTYNVPLVSQYNYIKGLSNWQGMLSDCIHPGDNLYAIKTGREAYVLSTIFSAM